MHPSSPSADLSQYALLRLCFGRAVFCYLLFRRTGEHDCASPAVAPQGASRRRSKSLLKHRVQGAALPAMHPSSASADLSQYALLRLCFGRAVFCYLLFRRTGEHDCASPAVAPQGASRRRSKSLLKHRVQGAALPAMHPSSPSADFISVCNFTALLRQSRFCFKGESAAKRCIPSFFARQTVLYYNCIGACRKGSKPVRFTQGSVSRARCTEKAVF